MVALSAVTGWLAVARLRAVMHLPSPELASVVGGLRKVPLEDRAPTMVKLAAADSWEGQLGRALVDAPSEAHRADVLSEAVNDVALVYGSMGRWPAAAIRIELLGGVLTSAIAVIRSDKVAAGVSLGVMVAGAVLVAFVGRKAAELERVKRAHVDALVRLLAPGSTPTGRAADPERSKARTRRRLDRQSSAM